MTENTETTAGPAYPPAPAPMTRPPLRRSRTDRVIGGVAGGFGEWLGIDPVVVRVVLVILAIFGGSGLLLYAAGWLFIPDEGATTSEAERFIAKGQRPGSTTRTVLIVIAAVLIAAAVINVLTAGPLHVWGFSGGGSILLLLAVGGVVLYLINRDPRTTITPPTPTTVTTPMTAMPPAASGPMPADPVSTSTLAFDSTSVEQPAYPATGFAYGGYGDYPGYPTPTPTPVAPRPPRPRSYLGLATLSLSLVTMGVMGALSLSGLVAIPLVVTLSAGLAVLGLGLLVGTLFGRARWLMAIAIPLLLVVALVAVIPANLKLPRVTSVGERSWSPTTVQQASTPYELTIGDAVLDLTGLTLPTTPSATYPIKASVGVGQLTVKVPAGMRVIVTATSGLGEVKIDGLPRRSGQNITVSSELPGLTPSAGPTVDLTAQVGIGSLEVTRA